MFVALRELSLRRAASLGMGATVWPYWTLFAYFAVGSLLTVSTPHNSQRAPPLLMFGLIAAAVMIGMRYEVGADWFAYLRMFEFARYADLVSMLGAGDVGYMFVNWAVYHLGFGVWLVNLLMAAIFCWGLYRFARVQPYPWLTVLLAVPYLIIVVAMGYTRQAAAIGVLLAALPHVLRGGSIGRFAIYVMIAALFHRTAIALLPLVIFADRRSFLLTAIGGLAATLVLYQMFLSTEMDSFIRGYVQAEQGSEGAGIRLAMNLPPAIAILAVGRQMNFSELERRIWRTFAYASVLSALLVFVVPSSTALDRIALYFIPIQLAVLPRLLMLFRGRIFPSGALAIYAFVIQFVWLNYADHAYAWLPYQFWPFS